MTRIGTDLTQLGTLKGLAEMALAFRRVCGLGRCMPDLSEFIAFLIAETRALSAHPSQQSLKEEALQLHTLLRWADSGLPAFDLTHGLTAALLLTDPSDVDGELVRLPFETFAIRLPDRFWLMHGHQGRETTASVAFVHSYTATTSKGPKSAMLSLRVVGRDGDTNVWESLVAIPTSGRIGEWLAEEVPMVDDPAGVVVPPDEHDKRLAVAMRRLTVNLSLYVTAHGRGEQLGRRKSGRGGASKQASEQASADIWIVGREVKLDRELVEAARAWTDARSPRKQAREAWRLHARFTVRGHWRLQAHGEGRALRRLTWIAPYWKGEGPSFAHVYKSGKGEGEGES